MLFPLVVYDCDGVILESVNAKTEAFYRVALKWGPDVAQKFKGYHLGHLGISRFVKFEWLFREVLHEDLTPAVSEDLGRQFADICLEEVASSPLVPGCLECLNYLSGKTALYIASGMPDEELNAIVKARGLEKYFTATLGSPPGKTELLRSIVLKEGIAPERTLMVGDSNTDLKAAQEVGCAFFGRGARFKDSGWPWHEDLTGLLEYLQETGEGEPKALQTL